MTCVQRVTFSDLRPVGCASDLGLVTCVQRVTSSDLRPASYV